MIAFGFLVLAGGTAAYVMAPSHLPTSEVTGAIAPGGSCQRPANPRILDQCVAACISCDHGTPVTCATSCRLKGAN